MKITSETFCVIQPRLGLYYFFGYCNIALCVSNH